MVGFAFISRELGCSKVSGLKFYHWTGVSIFAFPLLGALFSSSPKLFHEHFQALQILEECAIQIHTMSTLKNLFLCQIFPPPRYCSTPYKACFFVLNKKCDQNQNKSPMNNMQPAKHHLRLPGHPNPLAEIGWVVDINPAYALFKQPMEAILIACGQWLPSQTCVSYQATYGEGLFTLTPKVYMFASKCLPGCSNSGGLLFGGNKVKKRKA